ncbi:MAG: DUF1684 domain-containing protein [Actinomycetota bacterium]|nr:DUF1684 domain-containing protein [Actinomycetota bacterium]
MSLALLDWRRQVAALYASVRSASSPAEGHARWRAGRDELFAQHPESPIPADRRPGFCGLEYAPYDPALRFCCRLEAAGQPQHWQVMTGTDGLVSFELAGTVVLSGHGSLAAWWLNGYGGGLFIPFRDPGPRSYGGGRYLIDTVKGADLGGSFDPRSGDATLVIDLNFAYNPSCAYDPRWACPLAPATNRLEVPVVAGEQVPSHSGERADGTTASH